MKILVIGSNGQLGWELMRLSEQFDVDAVGFNRLQLDITSAEQVKKRLAEIKPAFVVNAAAYTDVDGAETESELAFAVNRDGVENIAQCCRLNNVPLIHISTDYVFDGTKGSPYMESDKVAPINIYGKSKEAGEQAVRSNLDTHIILRSSWLYGVRGHNFVKTMLKLGTERKRIRIVDDQYGSPTSVTDLAETILSIASRLKPMAGIDWGTYHYCGLGVTTWYGFAEAIFNIASTYCKFSFDHIEPITSADFPTKATRPEFSALNCGLIERKFKIHLKPWQESLKEIIERIYSEEQ